MNLGPNGVLFLGRWFGGEGLSFPLWSNDTFERLVIIVVVFSSSIIGWKIWLISTKQELRLVVLS